MSNICEKIKNLRNKKKVGSVEFSEIIGISSTTLWNIENGFTNKIDFAIIDKICEVYNLDHSYFSDNEKNINVKVKNGSGVGINYGEIVNCPEKAIEMIKDILKNYKKEN